MKDNLICNVTNETFVHENTEVKPGAVIDYLTNPELAEALERWIMNKWKCAQWVHNG